jgi:acetylornithine deacetylase/succinyl-diaminopimelate desuccinylase-like protein
MVVFSDSKATEMRPYFRPGLFAVCAQVTLLSYAGAQQAADVDRVMQEPRVRAALEAARAGEAAAVADQIRLCEIAAPPFMEAARAKALADAMRTAGLQNVRIDKTGNVLGDRPGRFPKPHLVLSAHLDTVFPEGTNVTVTRNGSVLRGPGIGDDCRGLAVLLAIARALDAAGIETQGSLTFVGTVGEEGLGDLRGVKALFADTLAGRIDRFISIDGSDHAITHVAVGSHRYRVTFRGAGGHSYDDFGVANPVHALGRAIAAIGALEVPDEPRTTFSVGRIGGGTSVNAIASEAWMEVDLRSSDPAALDALDAQFQQRIRVALDAENRRWKQKGRLSVVVDQVGDRPAGRTDSSTPFVQTAVAVTRALGLPVRLEQGSTDANVPMRLGLPALTVGSGGRGTGAHTVEETFDTTDSWRGTQRMVLFAIVLSR